eukprot:superscaffoldBa00001660_g11514
MKSAIKTSEESWIEQQMLEDKKRATDWEATNEAIEEQVARESYLHNQSRHHLEYRAIMQEMSPTAFGLTDWEDDEILASVLAVSQQEYLDSMKHQSTAMHREREPSPDSS